MKVPARAEEEIRLAGVGGRTQRELLLRTKRFACVIEFNPHSQLNSFCYYLYVCSEKRFTGVK